MSEYIEREALLNIPDSQWEVDGIDHTIRNAPAADVVEVVHGHWVGLEYDGYADGNPVYDLWECSECGNEVRGEDVPDTHPYCHGCGARMDGATDNNVGHTISVNDLYDEDGGERYG